MERHFQNVISKLLLSAKQNKSIYIIFFILIGSTGAYAVHSQEQFTSNTLFSEPTSDVRPMHITEVDKLMQNMLSGKISPLEAHDYIFNERFFAKKAGKTLTGSELMTNQKYIDYLNEADKITNSYYPDSQPDLTAMNNAKKALI